MKQIRSIIAGTIAALAITSCSDSQKTSSFYFNENFESFKTELKFLANGEWQEAYNSDVQAVVLYPMYFTHRALTETADGITQKMFYGFVPSMSGDRNDHTGDDWTKYQWGCIAPNPNSQAGANAEYGFMLACWDTTESTNGIPQNPSCAITLDHVGTINWIYIANSTFGYWAMKNGTAFSQPFGDDSYCRVNIIGVRNGKITKAITASLADNGEISRDWIKVDASVLGDVNGVYFQMESSDTGAHGMNNPAYFCIGYINGAITDK